MEDDLATRRLDYDGSGFGADAAGSDPMALFRAWFADAATREQVAEANAMTLATTAPDGTPSARMVLLKAVADDRSAFTWYTNLDSRKAREALAVGRAALCWWWPGSPGRQVRAVGRVEEVGRAESAAYFAQRPVDARVGAAASHQSRAVDTRAGIEARAAALGRTPVGLPERWGGLRLVAEELEFWQGRAGRLHDRIAFLRMGERGDVLSAAGCDAAGGSAQLAAAGTEVTDSGGVRWLRVRLEP